MEKTKMPNLRNGSQTGFERRLPWLRVRHSTAELPRSSAQRISDLPQGLQLEPDSMSHVWHNESRMTTYRRNTVSIFKLNINHPWWLYGLVITCPGYTTPCARENIWIVCLFKLPVTRSWCKRMHTPAAMTKLQCEHNRQSWPSHMSRHWTELYYY